MAVELFTLSFICALLLVIFLPVQRVRMSVPHLAILLWLAGIKGAMYSSYIRCIVFKPVIIYSTVLYSYNEDGQLNLQYHSNSR
jgi:hypothetical protein